MIKNEILENHKVSIIDKEIDGILGIELVNRLSGFQSVYFCCYLSPENSVWGRDSDSFFAHLTTQVYLHQDCDLILIGGDFNARIGSEDDYINEIDEVKTRCNIDEVKSGHGEAFIEFLKEARTIVLNGRLNVENDNFTSTSTRGKAVVDYLITTHDRLSLCENFRVKLMSDLINEHGLEAHINDTCKAPDHSLLTVYCQCTYFNTEANEQNTEVDEEKSEQNSRDNVKFYNYRNIPDNMFSTEEWLRDMAPIIEELLQNRLTQEQVDNMYDSICINVLNEMDKFLEYNLVSTSKVKKRLKISKPFWDNELSQLWKEVSRTEREYLKCKRKDRQFKQLREVFISTRNRFDKLLKNKARQYNYRKITTIENSANTDHNEFWKNIKKLGPHKTHSIPLKVNVGGQETTELREVKSKWLNDFSQLLNPDDNSDDFDQEFLESITQEKVNIEQNMGNETVDDINEEITVDELNKAVNRLKLKKATGIDSLPNEILKHNNLQECLLRLFQACFKHGVVPNIWRKALIKPIPKSSSKDPLIPLNYRGISLISCVSKLYSSIINSRIVKFCDEQSVLVEEQNGFRRARSCDDHIFSLTSIIENCLNDNKSTFCAFIDLEKAFDWLNRDLLLHKLLSLNIQGKIYYTIRSLLESTESCITLSSDINTGWFDVKAGVRQGDPLSPTLFSIYINDLVLKMKENCPTLVFGPHKVNSLLYADDMVLFAETEQDLQTCLYTLEKWCKEWRVKVNTEKSKIVHFRKARTLETEYDFTINNHVLEKVVDYKYLGIILDYSLSFEKCFKYLSGSGGRALGAIINKFKCLKNVGYKTFTKLFNSGVKSVLQYGSATWGTRKGAKSDIVQNRAMRYFLGVHKYTPTVAMLGDMGWFPLYIDQYVSVARYWNRLLHMDDSRLTKSIFEADYAVNNNNWSSRLLSILNDTDRRHIYDGKEVIILTEFQSLLEETYIEKWKNTLHSKPKLRTYVQIKDTYEIESYVKYVNSRKERSIMAQFRCGVLPLAIETGRYRNVPSNERFCFNCKTLVESELHFLLHCPLYDGVRQPLLDKATQSFDTFINLEDTRKFNYLLNILWKDVSVYLNKAWTIRRDKLFKV